MIAHMIGGIGNQMFIYAFAYHLSEKNNAPHLAESTVLYHVDDLFEGDIRISLQDGPEFTHHIGQSES